MSALLRFRSGELRPLAVDEWSAPARPEEIAVLEALPVPVLDLGCGPGRLTAALAEMGRPALGVDASPEAISSARRAGAPALQRSLFESLPGEGRWASVLLFDGNIGIGGDPVALLRRSRALLAADGQVIVEVEPPGRSSISTEARIERTGHSTEWFPWACVGADDLPRIATEAGLTLREWWRTHGRWFGVLAMEGVR